MKMRRPKLHDSATSIGIWAFDGCYDLTVRCTEDSDAYEYAQENGLDVEILH